MNYIQEAPHSIKGVQKVAVTATSQSIDLAGQSATIQNLGSGAVFISNVTATEDAFKIASGESISPLTGIVHLISDSTADVRILYSDPC